MFCQEGLFGSISPVLVDGWCVCDENVAAVSDYSSQVLVSGSVKRVNHVEYQNRITHLGSTDYCIFLTVTYRT